MKIITLATRWLLLLSFLCCLTPHTSADQFGDFTYTTADGKITITGYTGIGGAVSIPATIEGVAVTAIGEGAFEGQAALTSMTIPEGITTIGERAFIGCTGLVSVDIPASVTSIGPAAILTGGESDKPPGVLTSINVDPGNTNYRSVDEVLFNKDLTTLIQFPVGINGSYTIPDTVAVIGYAAFALNKNLTSIIITPSVTQIGDYAFYGGLNLVSVAFLGDAPAIGYSTFDDVSSNLKILYLPESTGFTTPTWQGVPTSPDPVITNPPASIVINSGESTTLSVTAAGSEPISYQWYQGTSRDTSIPVGSSSTSYTTPSLSESTNYWVHITTTNNPTGVNSSVATVVVPGAPIVASGPPQNITSNSANLTGTVNPNSLTTTALFEYGLTETYGSSAVVTITPENGLSPQDVSIELVGIQAETTYHYRLTATNSFGVTEGEDMTFTTFPTTPFILTVMDGEATITGITGSVVDLVIPDTIYGILVTKIASRAFFNRSDLTSVVIPSSVTLIGDSAFSSCSSLTSVIIPSSVRVIGRWAFGSCSSLSSIVIPEGVVDIGVAAFASNHSLLSIDVDPSNSLYSSLNGVLFNKDQSTLVQYPAGKSGAYILPDGVKLIGDYSFYNCRSLTEITFSADLTHIGDVAFDLCLGFKHLSIPEGVTHIGGGAFAQVWNMTSVSLPSSLISIGGSAFSRCYALTAIVIPENVSHIGDSPNYLCRKLSSITVNNLNPFYASLDGVLFNKDFSRLIQYPPGKGGPYNIPDGVISIGNTSFSGSLDMTTVDIPASVTSIGDSAFFFCGALKAARFTGNSPVIGQHAFYKAAPEFKVFYLDSSTGFTEPTWEGYPSQALQDPSILDQPNSHALLVGNTTQIEVSVLGTLPLSYQWYQGESGTTTTPVGNNSPTFTTPEILTDTSYWVRVTNAETSAGVDSDTATLTVAQLPAVVTSTATDITTTTAKLTGSVNPNSASTTAQFEYGITTSYGSAVSVLLSPDNGTDSLNVSADLTGLLPETTYHYRLTATNIAGSYSGEDMTFSTYPEVPFTYTTADGTITITRYTGTGGAVSIPATIEGVAVTAIGKQAFKGQAALTSMTIPEGITTIGDQAFFGCTGLVSIHIPASVTNIGLLATLTDDKSDHTPGVLTSVNVDLGNTNFRSVDGVLFNKDLTTLIQFPVGINGSYTIPDTVAVIGYAAFAFNQNLTSVIITPSVTQIGDYAFYGCLNLVSVAFLGDAPAIGNSTFDDVSSNLKILHLPESTGFTTPTWQGIPTSPDPVITNPPASIVINSGESTILSVTAAGSEPISYQWYQGLPGPNATPVGSDLSSFTTPNLNESTNYWVHITSGNNPTGVNSSVAIITVNHPPVVATGNSSGVTDTTATLGGAVTPNGHTTTAQFEYGLTTAYGSTVSVILSPDNGTDSLNVSADLTGLLPETTYHYRLAATNIAGTITGYDMTFSTSPEVPFTYTTADGKITITGYTGSENDLIIPTTINGLPVTQIRSRAFIGKTTLTSVTIPHGVTSIGSQAFDSCLSLTNVTIPQSVTNIDWQAFYHCASLASCTIPSSVITIGKYAFSNTGLTSVNIPASVTNLGVGVFSSCLSLLTITTDESNTQYSSIDGVLFNKNHTTIIQYPGGADNTYSIPSSVTTVGNDAFRGCSNLTDVTIPPSVTSIGVSSFYSCRNLSQITIPAGVTSIEYWGFYDSGLKRVYFSGGAPALGLDAFSNTAPGFTVYYLNGATGFSEPTWNGYVSQALVADPFIIPHSESVFIASGTTATLRVVALGTPSFTYQWYQGESGDTSTPVGGDSETFTTPSLSATTNYWVRVSNANNPAGVDSETANVMMLQLPEVATGTVINITDTAVKLTGTITPNGPGTMVQFEYGLTSSYGSASSVTLLPDNGIAEQAVGVNVSGLEIGQTYHYRLTSTNTEGLAEGADMTFIFARDDHENSIGSATEILVNSTTDGIIETNGDHDYFKIVLTHAGVLDVETTGSMDTVGHLLDVSGVELAVNDGAGANFRISQRLSPGTYYVWVQRHNDVGIGSYQLVSSFSALDLDEDNMEDAWEITYFGGLDHPSGGALDDPDGDGVANVFECFRGTSPLVEDSAPMLESLRGSDGSYSLRYWRSNTAEVEGVRFEWSSDLKRWARDGETIDSMTVTYVYTALETQNGVTQYELVPQITGGVGSLFVRMVLGVAPVDFSLIPAGEFLMGFSPGTTVNVDAFYIAKTEVTKEQWDKIATWAHNNGYDITVDGGAGKAANHPVQMVSWYECVKWCNAKSEKEGLTPVYTVLGSTYKTGDSSPTIDYTADGYRLPTEAEWEKAARGKLVGKLFPWGDTITHSQANYRSSSSYSYDISLTRFFHPAYNDGMRPYTSPVGVFAANGYGLFDLCGNVWECMGMDWYRVGFVPRVPRWQLVRLRLLLPCGGSLLRLPRLQQQLFRIPPRIHRV